MIRGLQLSTRSRSSKQRTNSCSRSRPHGYADPHGPFFEQSIGAIQFRSSCKALVHRVFRTQVIKKCPALDVSACFHTCPQLTMQARQIAILQCHCSFWNLNKVFWHVSIDNSRGWTLEKRFDVWGLAGKQLARRRSMCQARDRACRIWLYSRLYQGRYACSSGPTRGKNETGLEC
jgi:hypothetical protein